MCVVKGHQKDYHGLKILKKDRTMNVPIGGDGGNSEVVLVKVLTGQRELQEIFASVIDSFREANLVEEVQQFHDRVIVPALSDYSKALDYDQISEHVFVCKFKPMVELALLEMKAAATAPGWTDQMRKERVAEILSMAGF